MLLISFTVVKQSIEQLCRYSLSRSYCRNPAGEVVVDLKIPLKTGTFPFRLATTSMLYTGEMNFEMYSIFCLGTLNSTTKASEMPILPKVLG